MKILIYGLNFSPELTGVGKYTGEMALWLHNHSYDVRVVCAPPYYPEWRVHDGFNPTHYTLENFGNFINNLKSFKIFRCPIWVPTNPSSVSRIFHLFSFALTSFPVIMCQIFWRPNVIFVVQPTIMCAPSALILSFLTGAKSCIHIQDLEIDAAFSLGFLKNKLIKKVVFSIESKILNSFDIISTISTAMAESIKNKISKESDENISPKIIQFPNWVDLSVIYPLNRKSILRDSLNIPDNKVVILYSGNIGEKQGLEIFLEAAKILDTENSNILFVFCGEGSAKRRLLNKYMALKNVVWINLQPLSKLNELLNLADIHIISEQKGISTFVLPSKITGMFSSGKAVLGYIQPDSLLNEILLQNGMAVSSSVEDLVKSIVMLANDPVKRAELGKAGRQFASKNYCMNSILSNFIDNF